MLNASVGGLTHAATSPTGWLFFCSATALHVIQTNSLTNRSPGCTCKTSHIWFYVQGANGALQYSMQLIYSILQFVGQNVAKLCWPLVAMAAVSVTDAPIPTIARRQALCTALLFSFRSSPFSDACKAAYHFYNKRMAPRIFTPTPPSP